MGRTNQKLASFLKHHLELDDFKNLKWEDKSEGIFYIELPRFHKEKYREYEGILKAWYEFNGKYYKGYHIGKLVVQTVLRKSVYFIALPSIGKGLRFQFATSNQVKENKRLLKEKRKNYLQPASSLVTSWTFSSDYLE